MSLSIRLTVIGQLTSDEFLLAKKLTLESDLKINLTSYSMSFYQKGFMYRHLHLIKRQLYKILNKKLESAISY